MNLLQTTILGIIQGITEWFPISSSGHLRLTEHFLDLRSPILFDVVLHIGTLIVTLLFFRRDIKEILVSLLQLDFETEYGKLVPLIIVGTIPTVLIGLFFGEIIESFFQGVLPIAGAFIVCGVILYSSKKGHERKSQIDYLQALAIGTAQGIAIIPGLSRSGLTISVALLLGLKRGKAFKFSFLLSVPAIIGALSLTLFTQYKTLILAGVDWIEILAAITASMIVGYLAVRVLKKIVTEKRFHLFAFYCWVLSVALLVLGVT